MKESAVWRKLSRYISMYKPRGDWMLQRIETGTTTKGFPDVLFFEQGETIFVELKVVHGNKIDLSWEQVNYHTELQNMGFKTWVLGYKKLKTKECFYYGSGRYAEDIKEKGLESEHITEVEIVHKLSMYEMLVIMGLLDEIKV